MAESKKTQIKSSQGEGRKQILNYEVIEKLGEGGMGTVYLARDPLSKQKVAIKELHRHLTYKEEFLIRFRREPEILAKLDHPNIVKLYRYEESREGFFLVMEYAEGLNLEQYIGVTGVIAEKRARELMRDILGAFGYAHEKAIVHRDIKPSNIIITKEGKVKVLDFGIAKMLDDEKGGTRTGAQIGTVMYMSPEQVEGRKDIDRRTDIYSLGVLLHEMVTGQAPYDDEKDSWLEIQNKVAKEKLPRAKTLNANVTDGIQKVIDKATQKAREKRYQTCEAFKAGLEEKQTPDGTGLKRMLLIASLVLTILIGGISLFGEGEKTTVGDEEIDLNDFALPEPKEIEGMVFVKGGTFMMGSNDGDDDETPVHQVTVSDFYIGKYEVTNAEYAAFLNGYGNGVKTKSSSDYPNREMINLKGSWKGEKCRIYKSGGAYKVEKGYEGYPVIYVTWYGAQAYCKWSGGRLPTEAEWEYAAGSGSKHDKYSWGNGKPYGKKGGNVADETAKRKFSDWTIFEGYEDGYVYCAPVGKYEANELGIYDMTGNVWEWCSDWKAGYSSSSQTNPTGPSSGSNRVNRGGSWFNYASYCRVAYRDYDAPTYSNDCLGFRLVSPR